MLNAVYGKRAARMRSYTCISAIFCPFLLEFYVSKIPLNTNQY